MIPIKIHCGCGQPYAFDIEPINNQMPHAVACPTCGMDGTLVANQIIAQSVPVAIPVAVPVGAAVAEAAPARTGTRLRAMAPAPSAAPSARNVSNLPQMDRSQVDHEARAKIFWGDEPDAVMKFMMMHGVPYAEASEVVNGFAKERAAITRATGVKKIIIGSALVSVPIIAFIIFASIGFFPVKILGACVAVGLYGAYLLLTGAMMLIAPKIEKGDVAEL